MRRRVNASVIPVQLQCHLGCPRSRAGHNTASTARTRQLELGSVFKHILSIKNVTSGITNLVDLRSWAPSPLTWCLLRRPGSRLLRVEKVCQYRLSRASPWSIQIVKYVAIWLVKIMKHVRGFENTVATICVARVVQKRTFVYCRTMGLLSPANKSTLTTTTICSNTGGIERCSLCQ